MPSLNAIWTYSMMLCISGDVPVATFYIPGAKVVKPTDGAATLSQELVSLI